MRPNPISESERITGVKEDAGTEEDSHAAKLVCAPCMPTSAEVELHNATHVPFRSWCAFCVAGKAKCNPHFRKATDRVSGVRVVDIDYAFLGQEGDLKPDEVEEDEISVPAVAVVELRHSQTQCVLRY